MTTTATVEYVKTRERVCLDLIDPNPWQPRQQINPTAVRTLADSIREIGLLQVPMGRRTEEGRVQLAFGHRRVAACLLLYEDGVLDKYIEVDIADLSDQDMAVMAITENDNREQLSQLELIQGYRRAIDETGLSVQGLANKLVMSRPKLANNLRLLALPDFILEYVESGALRLTVAREFLVLHSSDHAHTEDMQEVVRRIINRNSWEPDPPPPDWSRRNVRRQISERVAYNEKEYRPMGPEPEPATAGATREPNFDVDAFLTAHDETLFHRIPIGASTDTAGRLWTCAVKDWTREQTRTTREANKEAVESGRAPPAASSQKAVSRDKQFEQLLASDPVWKQITVSRETPGPNRPTTDEEREQLGTRSELREMGSYGDGFWKILQKGGPESSHEWERDGGGPVPPWSRVPGSGVRVRRLAKR